eukprot:Rmarinus@m.724
MCLTGCTSVNAPRLGLWPSFGSFPVFTLRTKWRRRAAPSLALILASLTYAILSLSLMVMTRPHMTTPRPVYCSRGCLFSFGGFLRTGRSTTTRVRRRMVPRNPGCSLPLLAATRLSRCSSPRSFVHTLPRGCFAGSSSSVL